MNALWLDTGPLLELVAHQLGAPGSSQDSRNASRRLQDKLIALTSKARLNSFEDSLRSGRIGEIRYSSGSLVELYNHIRQPLGVDSAAFELVHAFWSALANVSGLLGRPVKCVAMARDAMDPSLLSRLGPVDAHLVAALEADKESWLFTTDGPLERSVPDRSQSRLLQVTV